MRLRQHLLPAHCCLTTVSLSVSPHTAVWPGCLSVFSCSRLCLSVTARDLGDLRSYTGYRWSRAVSLRTYHTVSYRSNGARHEQPTPTALSWA